MVKLEAIDSKGAVILNKDGSPFTKELSNEQAEKLLQASNFWRLEKKSEYIFTEGHLVSKQSIEESGEKPDKGTRKPTEKNK